PVLHGRRVQMMLLPLIIGMAASRLSPWQRAGNTRARVRTSDGAPGSRDQHTGTIGHTAFHRGQLRNKFAPELIGTTDEAPETGEREEEEDGFIRQGTRASGRFYSQADAIRKGGGSPELMA